MKITKSKCDKIKVTGIEKLDPITIYLDDMGRGQGQITIKCWNEVWSAFWGAMGDRTIAEFFCSCDEHYIAKNLDPQCKANLTDIKTFKKQAEKNICFRKDIEINDDYYVDLLGRLEMVDENDTQSRSSYNLFCEIFGDLDWMMDMPMKPNPKYQYLCRIILKVQEILIDQYRVGYFCQMCQGTGRIAYYGEQHMENKNCPNCKGKGMKYIWKSAK